MRYFFCFLTIFFLSCGAAVQNQSSVQPEAGEVELAGSRLPAPTGPLEVIVSCEGGMDCTTQEMAITMALGQEAVECFEGLNSGLYHFRVRLSRYGVQLTALPSLQRFPGQGMVCLRGYLGRIGQIGEGGSIEFTLRYTPPRYKQTALFN